MVLPSIFLSVDVIVGAASAYTDGRFFSKTVLSDPIKSAFASLDLAGVTEAVSLAS
jgi:hypothetical protein